MSSNGDKRDRLKPGVDKHVLLLLAGALWIGVGTMLLCISYSWLSEPHRGSSSILVGIGIAAAMLIHHFGFLRIVDRNLRRIMPLEGRRCVFSFMPWKSYLLVMVMATAGLLLRHSSVPKPLLSTVYIGIGLGLVLSSVRYLRILISDLKKAGS